MIRSLYVGGVGGRGQFTVGLWELLCMLYFSRFPFCFLAFPVQTPEKCVSTSSLTPKAYQSSQKENLYDYTPEELRDNQVACECPVDVPGANEADKM